MVEIEQAAIRKGINKPEFVRRAVAQYLKRFKAEGGNDVEDDMRGRTRTS
jgi:hypothetical protein